MFNFGHLTSKPKNTCVNFPKNLISAQLTILEEKTTVAFEYILKQLENHTL